LSYIQLS